MVKVCDAIMGSGKTSATISYINSHPEKKFIYITPYLEEATRIKEQCPSARFVEPSKKLPKYQFSKSTHTEALIEEGRNITSTHQCMTYYTPKIIHKIKEKGYTLIIDEEVNILSTVKGLKWGHVRFAIDTGYVCESAPDTFTLTGKSYGDGEQPPEFVQMFKIMESRPLLRLSHAASERHNVWYWIFPPELFKELDDVIVMTYLFKGSEMESFFKINNIEWKYMGIHHETEGSYEFVDEPEYVPEYVKNLKDMIHIEQSEKLNSIGCRKTDLSMGWYDHNKDGVETLKKHIYNFFRQRTNGAVSERLCGTYKDYWGCIRAKGYWNSDARFNERATNKYCDRHVVAYPVNLYMSRNIANFYTRSGAPIDDDMYALSTMVQFIWRSAIRKGEPISLYVPSSRMRKLLMNWIDTVSKGGDIQ